MQKQEQEHKRRVRYSGRYPRKFEEKYKELQPEKYAEEIEKIKAKGKTPAGTHIPIMVGEILEFLDIKPGMRGLDATLGYGGHSEKMLEKLAGEGHLLAIDVDGAEMAKTTERLRALGYGEDILSVKKSNFADIAQLADEYGKFDFILADLGVSSMQIDNPERGFSYKFDGPLDLRLDQSKGVTASERLFGLSEEEIAGMLLDNADEPYAAQIAKAISRLQKSGTKIVSTTQLSYIIANALAFLPPKERNEAVKKSCRRTFQALRIDVNSEYEVLESFMEALPQVLNPGGKAAILTFHSGEDRIVKKALKRLKKDELLSEIAAEVVRPSASECYQNPRAHSTKMRWAVK